MFGHAPARPAGHLSSMYDMQVFLPRLVEMGCVFAADYVASQQGAPTRGASAGGATGRGQESFWHADVLSVSRLPAAATHRCCIIFQIRQVPDDFSGQFGHNKVDWQPVLRISTQIVNGPAVMFVLHADVGVLHAAAGLVAAYHNQLG